jgi:preprotein translocase subunit YajC
MENNGTFLLVFMALAIVAMLFMSSRARKRQAEATAFRTTLQAGQRVMTTSGMFGTVVGVDGDKVTLATSGGQESEWLLAAIAKLVDDEETAATDSGDDALEDETHPPTDLGTNPTIPPRDDTAR